MAFFWKDFNKTAKDACKTGKASEYTMKFNHKNGNGVTYEAEQTKRGDGHASKMTWKMPKNSGASLDELCLEGSDGKGGYKGTTKWSHGGLVPDSKLKLKLGHSWNEGFYFNPIPKTAGLTLEYSKGAIRATGGVATKLPEAKSFTLTADAVMNMGDLNVGAMVKKVQGNNADLDYNVAAKYAMGDMSAVFQSSKCCSVFNVSLHNRVNSSLEVASMSTIDGKTCKQVFGGQYKIDGARKASLNLAMGDVLNFDANNLGIVASIANTTGMGKTTVSMQYKNGKSPKLGMKFETPK